MTLQAALAKGHDLYETCEYCGADSALAYSSDGKVLLCERCRPAYDTENPPAQREPFRVGGAGAPVDGARGGHA